MGRKESNQTNKQESELRTIKDADQTAHKHSCSWHYIINRFSHHAMIDNLFVTLHNSDKTEGGSSVPA